MTISYYAFVKFHGKKFGRYNMTVFYPNMCYNEVYYKETANLIIPGFSKDHEAKHFLSIQ